jgi:hypothetical protein
MRFTTTSKRKAWSIVVGIFALSGALWVFSGVREPSYQDRPLDFWLRALDSQSDSDPALQAIDAIGPKSIPALIHRLRDTDSRLKLRALNLAVRLGAIDRSRMTERLASTRRSQAVTAFTRLGARAKPAIPDLLKLTEDGDSQRQMDAWRALAGVAGDDINRYLTTKPVQLHSAEVRGESLLKPQ